MSQAEGNAGQVVGLLRALMDTLSDGVIVLDRSGVIVACNPSAERIVGRPASQLIGALSTALFEKTRELPPGTLHLGHPVYEISRSDGTQVWLSVIRRPIQDTQQNVNGILLYLADLTEHKLAEDSSAEAVAMRELLAQASNDAIWDWDLKSDRIWWSEGLRSEFGHLSESATDWEWWLDKIHPDDRRLVDASRLAVLKAGGRVWLREFRFRTASDEYLEVICRGHVVQGANGRPVRMFGAMQDVSQQKRVEADLHQSEALSRAVLSSLSTRIGVLDRDGIIIEVNDAWRRFERDDRLESESPLLVGDNYVQRSGITTSGDATSEAARREIRAVLRGARRRADLEYQTETRTGTRWFLMHVEPLRTERGGAVITHAETTVGRAAAEAKIRQLAAEQSEQAKTDLINTVSHELRTPLAVIRGHVTTVIEYGDRIAETRRNKSLVAADNAAQQLERLVSDLILMGRLESGVMRMEREPHSLAEILREAVESLEAIAGRIIDIRLPDEPLEIQVDRMRMIQVFYNLLDNAIKYSSPGTPIRIEVRHTQPTLAAVMIENRCTVLSQVEVDSIFDRFYRTKNAAKLNIGGAGLGLSISRGIVEAHEGQIWARAERGKFQVHMLLPKLRRAAEATSG